MLDVVERLWASEASCANKTKVHGRKCGEEWATTTAETHELRRLEDIDCYQFFGGEPITPFDFSEILALRIRQVKAVRA